MKCLIPALLFVLSVLTVTANGQDPFEQVLPAVQGRSDMNAWADQDPRYDTPKQAVQRKAAWKAAQRRQRLESMKRIGYSPSRPPTSAVPYMSAAPRWILVPTYYPTTVVYYPRSSGEFTP